jgi:hypothetical protein
VFTLAAQPMSPGPCMQLACQSCLGATSVGAPGLLWLFRFLDCWVLITTTVLIKANQLMVPWLWSTVL